MRVTLSTPGHARVVRPLSMRQGEDLDGQERGLLLDEPADRQHYRRRGRRVGPFKLVAIDAVRNVVELLRRGAQRHQPVKHRARGRDDAGRMTKHHPVRLGVLLENGPHARVEPVKMNDQRDADRPARLDSQNAGGAIFREHRIDVVASESGYIGCSGLSLDAGPGHNSPGLVRDPARPGEHRVVADAWSPAVHQDGTPWQPFDMGSYERLGGGRQIRRHHAYADVRTTRD